MNPDRLFELLEDYIEGTLSEEGRHQLEQTLLVSPEARHQFWTYIHQDVLIQKLEMESRGQELARCEAAERFGLPADLAMPKPSERNPEVAEPGPAATLFGVGASSLTTPPTFGVVKPEQQAPHSRAWTRSRALPALLAGLAAAVAVSMVWTGTGNHQTTEVKPSVPPVFAKMSEVVGDVEIIAEGQATKQAGPASELASGQTVRTGGDASSATVVYPDGIRLDLASGTVVRLGKSPPAEPTRKQVFLTSGMLRAEMPPSADDTPMIISTPHAEIRLHEATLTSSVGPTSTYVELEEGTAELVRNADGRPIRLTQGSFVVSTSEIQPLVARPVPLAPAEPRAIWKNSGPILAYAPDQSFLAVPWGERIEVCHPETGQKLSTLTGHNKRILQIAVAPSGKQLVSGGLDPYLIVWNTTDRQEQRRLPSDPSGTRCLALSPDGRFLAGVPCRTVGPDLVTLWDMSTGDELRKLTDEGGGVATVAFSPDRRLLAGAGDRRIVLWDPHTGKVIRTLKMGKVRPRLLAFTADGRYLIGVCQDHNIRFWDTNNWEIVKTHACGMSECGSLAVAPARHLVAWGLSDGTVEVWKVDADLQLRQLVVYRKFRKRGPESLAFSPDAKTLATTRYWEPVKLWNVPEPLK